MNRPFQIVITLLIILFHATTLQAQNNFFKKIFKKDNLTKKELIQENSSLKEELDSLLKLTQGGIIFSDSTSINDTINPGTLFFSNQDLEPDDIKTDSLLHAWYIQKSLTTENIDKLDMDTTPFESNVPDSVYIERLERMNSYITLPYNKIVRNHIIYYSRKGKNISNILGLAEHYMPQFEEIFDYYDLPKELKAMAVIESALNPKAVSRVKARGMWQFMYQTAKQYELNMNSFVDERYDPIASGHAAAKYLRDSYSIFKDWSLAIASYNCGIGNVNKAIRRAGSREFWDIYPFLPRETRGYVPAFVGALYTLNYYKEHQIVPAKITLPVHIDTFRVNKMLHFGQISEIINIPIEEIRALNPQYLHDIIPGVEQDYILRLPFNYTTKFVENEDSIYKHKAKIFLNSAILAQKKSQTNVSKIHKVKYGQTLGGIALAYRVRISDLQRWNNLKNSNIRVGQRLYLYPTGSKATVTTTKSAPITTKSNGYLMYTVKNGDSLWEIAKKFNGVSFEVLLSINNFTDKSKIYPGNKIKIKKL